MYVIYPADELLRIYENPDGDPSSVLTGDRRPSCQVTVIAVNERNDRPRGQDSNSSNKRKKERRRERGGRTRRRRANRNEIPRSHEQAKKSTRPEQHARTMQNSRAATGEDAVNPLKDLTQPGLNEPLKQHNAATLKLVQTGECFTFISSFSSSFFLLLLLL